MTKAEEAPTAQEQFLTCPRCGSDQAEKRIIQPGQPGHGTHHSKAVCLNCNSFIRWLPDPKVTAAFEARAKQAARMLRFGNLTQFERGFLDTMTTQRKLSPRQEEIWRGILVKSK